MRRSRVELIFKVYILQRSAYGRTSFPNNSVPETKSCPVTVELLAYRMHGQRTLGIGNVAGADLSHSGHRLRG
jgi:hypothetical protein